MQCVPRGDIVSDEHNNEAPSRASQKPSTAAQGMPARTRGSRKRVVRGAGAAGASVPVVTTTFSAVLQTSQASQTVQAPQVSQASQVSQSHQQPEQNNQLSKREQRLAKLSAELFVDSGIPASNEAKEASRAANSRNTSVSVAQSSKQSEKVFSNSEKSSTQKIKPARAVRKNTRSIVEKTTEETIETSNEQQSQQLQHVETAPERSERARKAVSQMLEFSAPDRDADETVNTTTFHTRPMMSLLFQEPVIPEKPVRTEQVNFSLDDIENALDESADSDEDNTSNKGSRRRRSRKHNSEDESSNTRKRKNRNHQEDQNSRDAQEEEDFTESRPSRRSRRLNAQERRAAAEVELIENDIELDEIEYEPIEIEHDDDEFDSDNESDSESDNEEIHATSRRRRRRRGVDRDTRSSKDSNDSDDDFTESSSSFDEDDDEEVVSTRRRRRRRNKSADSSSSSSSNSNERIPRSRKQQYIDEITDIEGSTRLEAKKQRRRDNRRDRDRQSLITEQDFLARRENVNRLLVVREKDSHTQVSVIEDNVLVEHYVSDIQEVSSVGNIYRGRVQNVLPSMEAAFVDIGQHRNGVLYAGEVNWDTTRLDGQPRRMEHAFKSGDPVLVQVTKDSIGHKGARLTSQVTLAGRFLVLVPSGSMTGVSRKLPERERARLKSIVAKIAPEEMGVIIRTAAEGASEEALTKDLEQLKNKWANIEAKLKEYESSKRPQLLQGEPDVVIRVVRDIFNDDFNQLVVEGDSVYERIKNYLESTAPDLLPRLEKWDPEEHQGKDVFDKWSIDSQLRKGMERQVYLPSGGSLVIDRTEAMTTIDINTGRFIGKGKSLEETVTRCNLEAAEEIVRQLRLRDIGGMVMIDFVDMVMPANRDLVLRRLVECLSRDRTKHQVAEVTSLGLVQMTRKRVGQGLVEAFSEECPTCGGRGFILHDEPTVSAKYDDPYALKGGDPFIKTHKYGHESYSHEELHDSNAPQGSTPAVKATLAQIAAAAVAADEAKNREE